jgi:hypothetical protein
VPDTGIVTGSEFVRKIQKLGRKREVRELKPGTLHGMLDQLGLSLNDFR